MVEQPAEPTTQERSSGVKLRRGLVLTFMTLLVPGSAQLAAGNKTVGRNVLRAWATSIVLLVLFGVLFLVKRDWAVSLVANKLALTTLAIIVVVIAVVWIALFIDAWRLARPKEMTRKPAIGLTVLTGVLCLAIVGLSFGAARSLTSAGSFIDTVFPGGGDVSVKEGRYNILLIGGDAGSNREGLRADSINVASIDAGTGRTVLFGLPRNLEHVPFPESSPLHELYPNGFWCESHECLLNAIYMLGEENKDKYPGVKYPGVKATTEAVEATLGISINYFAMIDMYGFVHLIDAVGGIRISTDLKVPIGGGTSPISGYIGPGKNLQLDGYHALWFARSREGASDYERMARQKCVMNAMLQQLDPVTVFTKFSDIAEAGKDVIATDVPSTEIGTLLDLADKGRKLPIRTVSFTPPLIATGKPDFNLIRSTTKQAIAQSEALDTPGNTPASSSSSASAEPSQSASKRSTSTASASPTSTSTGNTDDLDAICQVA